MNETHCKIVYNRKAMAIRKNGNIYPCCRLPKPNKTTTDDTKMFTVEELQHLYNIDSIPDVCNSCVVRHIYNNIDDDINGLVDITIQIGTLCNSSCLTCIGYWERKIKVEEDKYEVIHKLLDDNKNSLQSITILGGETFIYKKEIIDIIPYLLSIKDAKILFHINGSICDEELIKNIAQLKHVTIAFSIDGDYESNHILRPNCEMEKIIKTIDLCRKYNITIRLNHTISILNIPYLYNNLKYYLECLQFDYITLNLVTYPDSLDVSNIPIDIKSKVLSSIKELKILNKSKSLPSTLDDGLNILMKKLIFSKPNISKIKEADNQLRLYSNTTLVYDIYKDYY